MHIAERVKSVEWFTNVGQEILISYSADLVTLSSWIEASRECESPQWENRQIEARNDTTSYLNLHHKNEFQRWNFFANEAKQILADDFDRLRRLAFDIDIAASVVDSALWDILNAAIEDRYQHLGSPRFFIDLFPFYEAGHFPCGWRGNWPDGALVVF